MLRRAVTGLIAALLLAGALAGCGGGSSPGSSRTVTVSPGPSSPVASSPAPDGSGSPSAPRSPSSAAPRTGPLTTGPGVKPGEKPPVESRYAKQHNTAGALAFAWYYYRALDWSLATTNAYLLTKISAPSCATCKEHIRSIDALADRGGHVEGARIQPKSVVISDRHEVVKSDYVVKVVSSQQRGAIVSASGTRSATIPASAGSSYVLVSWARGTWWVIEESRN